MVAVTAGRTPEIMGIPNGTPTAPGTSMGAVPRVYIEHKYASSQGFVFYEPLELSERPGIVDISPLFPDLGPFPYASQLLHDNDIAGLEAVHYPTAYVMVNPSDYSALLPRKPFQELPRPSRAFGLESRTQSLIPPPYMYSVSAGKSKSIGAGGNVVYAEVYPHHLAVLSRCWSGNGIGQDDIDVEILASTNERGVGGLLPLEKLPLVVADGEGDLNPPLNGGEGYHLLGFYEIKDALVVGNGSRLKPLDFILLRLISARSPCYRPYGKIGCKLKHLLDVIIAGLLELEFVSSPKLLSLAEDIVTCVGKRLEGGFKGFRLLRSRLQFANYRFDQHHPNLIISIMKGGVKGTFLPPLKEWASCARLL